MEEVELLNKTSSTFLTRVQAVVGREMTDPATTPSILLGMVLCGIFTLLVLSYSSNWLRGSKSGAKLPKGSLFSWPIFGETFALIRDPLEFSISHTKKYGSLFKCCILFRNTICGTSTEFAKFVLLNPDLFPVQYPSSIEFISPASFFFVDSPRHIAVKKLYTKFALPESLGQNTVQTLESIILENLASWEEQGTVVGSEVTDKLVEETSSYIALGVKNIRSTPEGRLGLKNLRTMIDCVGAVPVNFPGTTHYKGRKAKAAVESYLNTVVEKRMSQPDTESDILKVLLQARESAQGEVEKNFFDTQKIVGEMVGTWFAAFKSSATTLTWTLKFLADHPDVFRRIQAEQQEILKGKDISITGPRLTWEDIKKMVYTTKVLHEIQRLLSIAFGLPRIATEEVVYDGYLIPKGWAVLPFLNMLHHDPASHKDPYDFNPDRFNEAPKPNTYLAFGLGRHRCPGEEIIKLAFLIHVHHLSTTYKVPQRELLKLLESIRAASVLLKGLSIRIVRWHRHNFLMIFEGGGAGTYEEPPRDRVM